MEFLKEAIASRNIVAWIILIVLLILFVKFLKSVGKGFVLLLVMVGCFFVLAKTFPGLFDPLIDFVRGGWMGSNRPDRPW